jgi:hypothetical protein
MGGEQDILLRFYPAFLDLEQRFLRLGGQVAGTP